METLLKKPSITVFGSFAVDLMSMTPRLPIPGETVLGGPFKLGPGGKGSNQATAAARAGADVTMITKIGVDEFAKVALNHFKNEGIHSDFVIQDKQYNTGAALIMVDQMAENMIVIAPGANNHITKNEIYKTKDNIAKAEILLTQLETNIDATMYAIDVAHDNGVKVILNPAPAQMVPNHVLKKIYILTPNETEAASITGIQVNTLEDAKRAGEELLNKGVENVVITLGKNGALIVNQHMVKHIPTAIVDAVDTTGAGDGFNGGLSVALAEGKSLEESVKFANYLATLSVTKTGTAISMPYRHEIDAFVINNSLL